MGRSSGSGTSSWSGAGFGAPLLISMAIVVAGLYLARDVLIPLALAVLLTFLLAPMVHRLERWGLGRILSTILVVTLVSALLVALGAVALRQVVDLARRLPEYRDNLRQKVQALRSGGGGIEQVRRTVEELGRELTAPATTQATKPATSRTALQTTRGQTAEDNPQSAATQPISVRVEHPPSTPLQLLYQTVGPLLGPLGTAGLVIVFVIFMLLAREDLRDRLIRLVGAGQINLTTAALDEAGERISRYLTAMAIVNGTYGLAVALGLWLIGWVVGGRSFPNALLWGVLCALLRFIPYIGPWIAAAMPIAVSVAVFPGWGVAVTTVSMFVLIELLSNNFMEPVLYGSSTGMSEVAVLVAAVFWTWLWGALGLLLSTPLTVCLVVAGKYVPQLWFLNVLLGDEPVLSDDMRLYQRLLAVDQEEAQDLVEEHLKQRTAVEVCDQVMLPALRRAEEDRHHGRLDEDRAAALRQGMRELVEELPAPPTPDPSPPASRPSVVCLPARDEADEVAAAMLVRLLELEGIAARLVPVAALASEMIQAVRSQPAAVVCISALPPSAVPHARYLCKRLGIDRPDDRHLLIGLWTARGDPDALRQRLHCHTSDMVVTSLTDALRQIVAMPR